MNVQLHIERLVLDGLDLGTAQPQQLQAAIESELARLLGEGGVAPALAGGTALARIAVPAIQMQRGEPVASAGARIAAAVYGGIGQ